MDVKCEFKTTIGGSGTGATYVAPAGVSQTWILEADVDVKQCWYTPVDNIESLSNFHTIEVYPSKEGNVTLSVKTNNNAALIQIWIYVAYDEAA